LPKGFFLIQC